VVVISYDVADRVATVTLCRPEVRNALNVELLRAIRTTMTRAEADPDAEVVILTGADPAFCAGLDLRELGSTGANLGAGPGGDRVNEDPPSATTGATVRTPVPGEPRGPTPFAFWGPMTKPVIGAVNGAAVTGGLELALQCDWLVASERAAFGDTHARVGVMPGGGLTVLLPQAIGLRRAREMSLTGNFVSAADAHAWGLVNHVVPHDELLPTARRLARDVCGVDQRGVRAVLGTYRQVGMVAGAEGLAIEQRRGREFQREAGGFDPAEVERRRQAIIERGRGQA